MAPLRAHFTLLHNSKIVGSFAHQFKGAVFTPVLKGVDTQVVHTHSLIVGAVADHIPLKQGLRPPPRTSVDFVTIVADHIPLKQGLRRGYLDSERFVHQQVADHIPLKQGLRPLCFFSSWYADSVADHIPLKQGLRQCKNCTKHRRNKSRRPYSIKTRIKTFPVSIEVI